MRLVCPVKQKPDNATELPHYVIDDVILGEWFSEDGGSKFHVSEFHMSIYASLTYHGLDGRRGREGTIGGGLS